MKPLYIWDARNRQHIGKHDISEEEAEFVLDRAAPPFPREVGSGKRMVRGQTARGRYLQVIFAFRPSSMIDYDSLSLDELDALEDERPAVYVVHARDLTDREKRRFRNRS